MSEEPLAVLLEKLCSGDTQAAEEVFRAYEPILRSVVRRQLGSDVQAGFDSIDVVQSVWVDLLEGFRSARWSFVDAEHLRAFLIKATRNRFLDKTRRHQNVRKYEELAKANQLEGCGPFPLPRPSEVAQAEELWDQLLARCSPGHREILRLKREGLSAAEIASRIGKNEDHIRRILRNLASQLALKTSR